MACDCGEGEAYAGELFFAEHLRVFLIEIISIGKIFMRLINTVRFLSTHLLLGVQLTQYHEAERAQTVLLIELLIVFAQSKQVKADLMDGVIHLLGGEVGNQLLHDICVVLDEAHRLGQNNADYFGLLMQ